MQILKPNKKSLKVAVEILNNGGVIVCPTDTVYGFLADAGNKKATNKIYNIKKRPRSKPLPVFVSSIKQAKNIAKIDKEQEKILKKYWPGKYTFVLKRKKIDVGRLSTIALRIPKYRFLNNLIKKINKPLAQTSVNISGQPPLTKISEIIKFFGANFGIDLIIDVGNLPKSKSSRVIDLTRGGKILRY